MLELKRKIGRGLYYNMVIPKNWKKIVFMLVVVPPTYYAYNKRNSKNEFETIRNNDDIEKIKIMNINNMFSYIPLLMLTIYDKYIYKNKIMKKIYFKYRTTKCSQDSCNVIINMLRGSETNLKYDFISNEKNLFNKLYVYEMILEKSIKFAILSPQLSVYILQHLSEYLVNMNTKLFNERDFTPQHKQREKTNKRMLFLYLFRLVRGIPGERSSHKGASSHRKDKNSTHNREMHIYNTDNIYERYSIHKFQQMNRKKVRGEKVRNGGDRNNEEDQVSLNFLYLLNQAYDNVNRVCLNTNTNIYVNFYMINILKYICYRNYRNVLTNDIHFEELCRRNSKKSLIEHIYFYFFNRKNEYKKDREDLNEKILFYHNPYVTTIPIEYNNISNGIDYSGSSNERRVTCSNSEKGSGTSTEVEIINSSFFKWNPFTSLNMKRKVQIDSMPEEANMNKSSVSKSFPCDGRTTEKAGGWWGNGRRQWDLGMSSNSFERGRKNKMQTDEEVEVEAMEVEAMEVEAMEVEAMEEEAMEEEAMEEEAMEEEAMEEEAMEEEEVNVVENMQKKLLKDRKRIYEIKLMNDLYLVLFLRLLFECSVKMLSIKKNLYLLEKKKQFDRENRIIYMNTADAINNLKGNYLKRMRMTEGKRRHSLFFRPYGRSKWGCISDISVSGGGRSSSGGGRSSSGGGRSSSGGGSSDSGTACLTAKDAFVFLKYVKKGNGTCEMMKCSANGSDAYSALFYPNEEDFKKGIETRGTIGRPYMSVSSEGKIKFLLSSYVHKLLRKKNEWINMFISEWKRILDKHIQKVHSYVDDKVHKIKKKINYLIFNMDEALINVYHNIIHEKNINKIKIHLNNCKEKDIDLKKFEDIYSSMVTNLNNILSFVYACDHQKGAYKILNLYQNNIFYEYNYLNEYQNSFYKNHVKKYLCYFEDNFLFHLYGSGVGNNVEDTPGITTALAATPDGNVLPGFSTNDRSSYKNIEHVFHYCKNDIHLLLFLYCQRIRNCFYIFTYIYKKYNLKKNYGLKYMFYKLHFFILSNKRSSIFLGDFPYLVSNNNLFTAFSFFYFLCSYVYFLCFLVHQTTTFYPCINYFNVFAQRGMYIYLYKLCSNVRNLHS
ncbi:conserved Plasmodium protein, unknown function [Plasmodium malariae]|uniref:Uncharacterized protein n=1 Tax=Plasmodium malariae TaxID=5858 RepID=A0A1D3PBL2_PLAMA|nr:conserved Plasmodium protein, unknown function [Plasmodium malariae]SCN12298.1 conserved Plasmodium protein, unknown function [Plasmodium malariae]